MAAVPRSRVAGRFAQLRADTVVVTHFLAINAVVGAATGDDRVVCFAPAHCSRTTVELDPGPVRCASWNSARQVTGRRVV